MKERKNNGKKKMRVDAKKNPRTQTSTHKKKHQKKKRIWCGNECSHLSINFIKNWSTGSGKWREISECKQKWMKRLPKEEGARLMRIKQNMIRPLSHSGGCCFLFVNRRAVRFIFFEKGFHTIRMICWPPEPQQISLPIRRRSWKKLTKETKIKKFKWIYFLFWIFILFLLNAEGGSFVLFLPDRFWAICKATKQKERKVHLHVSLHFGGKRDTKQARKQIAYEFHSTSTNDKVKVRIQLLVLDSTSKKTPHVKKTPFPLPTKRAPMKNRNFRKNGTKSSSALRTSTYTQKENKQQAKQKKSR